MAAVENKQKDFTKNHIINWYWLNVACVKEDGRTISEAFTTRLFVMADSCGEAEQKAIAELKKREKCTRSVVTSMSRLNVLATLTRTEEEEEVRDKARPRVRRKIKVILDNWILYEVKCEDDSTACIFINEHDQEKARKYVEAFLKAFCKGSTIVEAYGIDYVAR